MAKAKSKKRFFDIKIPLINKTTQLIAYEPKELNGRFIKYDLTRILRGKNIIIKFLVKLKDKELITIPKEIKLMPNYLKRMVRKGTNYIEDSFSTQCKDAQIRIKPFLITRRKVSRAVRKALRNKTKEELNKYIKNKKSGELFNDILKNQLQKQLSIELKKIYPLSLCEIRILKVEKEITNE
jgi:ribosomal protein S3AE